jgi:hypothetical protein
MTVYDLDTLKRDASQSNLYNMFDQTFKYLTGLVLSVYIVDKSHEMRLDLISNQIYGNVNYCDFLLDLNNIDNPLNIMENDQIVYVSQDQIGLFRINESTAKELRNIYLNATKVSKPDNKRLNYVENNYKLPPTFLQIPAESVRIVDGKIVLGGNS